MQTPTELMEIYLTDVVGKGQLALLDTMAHEDMVDEANQAFGGPPGRAGLVNHVKGFHKNIGSPQIEIHRVVAGNDEVMARWSFTGTLDGPWLGLEPTGCDVAADVFSFLELRDGLISVYRLWLHARVGAETVTFDSANPVVNRFT